MSEATTTKIGFPYDELNHPRWVQSSNQKPSTDLLYPWISNDESVIKDINQIRLQEITKVREETSITMKWHWNEENVQENGIEMKRMSKTNSKGM